MTLWDRLYDNEWFVARTKQATHTDLAEEVRRAQEALTEAAVEVERARTVSPAAVAVALSGMNAAQAALDRAEARSEAARMCTHVVAGHAFTITVVDALDGSRSAWSSRAPRSEGHAAVPGPVRAAVDGRPRRPGVT